MIRMHVLFALIRDILRSHPVNTLLSICLMILKSLTAGIGLLFILPLLQFVGLSNDSYFHHPLMHYIQSFLKVLHIPVTLLSILSLYTVIMVFVALLAYLEQLTSSRLQRGYITQLRMQLHRELLQMPWPFFLNRKMTDILYTLTNQVQSVSLCQYQVIALMNQLILMFFYTALACLLSLKMTLLAILSASLLLSFMLPLHRLTSKAGQQHLSQNQQIFQMINEQFSALKMIKSSGLEERFVDKLVAVNDNLERENQFFTTVMAKSKLFYACGSGVTLSVLLYVALEKLHLSVSVLLVLLFIFARILPLVSSCQQCYQRILHHLPAYSAILSLRTACLKEKHLIEFKTEQLSFQKGISLKNVSFYYPSNPSRAVINNFSCYIRKNSTVALIGPSGVGKSTLADLLVGLIKPTAGEIWVDQTKLTASNLHAWRSQIAYLTQETFLFNASIRDNLTWFGAIQKTDSLLWEALNQSGSEFVSDLEDGLDTYLGDRGIRLSGGERQRIALARALLTPPSLLILDESTNALDDASEHCIQQALRLLEGKTTILIISHQKTMKQFAEDHIILEEERTHEAILEADKTTVM